MKLRRAVLVLIAALGVLAGLTAPAAALEVPTLPTVTAPTVEPPPLPAPSLPAPTLPAPTPTVPAPAPTVTTPPSLPAPTPTLPTTTSSSSAPAPAPSSPASQVTQTVQSATSAVTGGTAGAAAGSTAGTAGGVVGSASGTAEPRTGATAGAVPGGYFAGGASAAPMPVSRVPIVASSSSGNAPSAKRPKRPRKIVLGFVSYQRGRLALPVVQISPVCRRAGTIGVNARPGVNLIRFNGRLGKRWLLDGTYVLVTPTMRVRFAVVAGRPTRKKTRLQPSTCRAGMEVILSGGSLPPGSAGYAAGETVPVTAAGGITDVGAAKVLPTGQSGPSKVLGTTIDSVKSVVTGLHPAFYVLLAIAIAALATATLPVTAFPSPWLGATLARRRAELTLAGTMALVTVIVAYLLTVGT